MTTIITPLVRHLTHDETVSVADRKGQCKNFRIRIWQGLDAVPMVLATIPQLQPQPLDVSANPSSMSSKIANFVNTAMLGHPVHGLIYFEADPFPVGLYSQVYFEYFGTVHRLVMYKPDRVTNEWARLEAIIGEKIEQ